MIAGLLLATSGCGLVETLFEDESVAEENYADEPSREDEEATEETPASSAIGVFEVAACEYEDDYNIDLACGYVAVPENYADPNGNQVYLAVTIIRSPGGARFADPGNG